MNLNMVQLKNETEDILLSNTKNCETPNKQTHTRPEETLEFKMTKSRELFSFYSRIQMNGDWMLGLTSLEVYNSISNLTEETNKFKLYNFPHSRSGGFSYQKVRDEIEKKTWKLQLLQLPNYQPIE